MKINLKLKDDQYEFKGITHNRVAARAIVFNDENKVGILPFVLAGLCIVVLFALIYVIVSSINKAPTQVDELMPREECVYEFTY